MVAKDEVKPQIKPGEMENAALRPCGGQVEISFGVWRGLPRLHFLLLVLLLGGVGHITGNTMNWLCDTHQDGQDTLQQLLCSSYYESLNTASRIHWIRACLQREFRCFQYGVEADVEPVNSVSVSVYP